MSDIEILDPTKYSGWDDLLLTNTQATFFHTAGWARVLQDAYRYEPLYFTQKKDQKLHGLLAVMAVRSILTGKRGVSLPFTDHCPLIAGDRQVFENLLWRAIEHGKQKGWKSLGIRGNSPFLRQEAPDDTFLTHELVLNTDEKRLLSGFRGSNRRNIKKAQKQGVAVEKLHTQKALQAFYRLNCMTRKDHGLPPQPACFFDNVHRHVIASQKGVVLLAKKGDRFVAGAVYFQQGDRVIYKYGASDRRYQHLRANNLVMWEAIRYFSKKGFKVLDFGRTEVNHAGLRRFKRSFGASEKKSRYHTYDLKKDAFVAGGKKVKSSYALFNTMPMPLLKLTGRLLYRHVG